MNVRGVRVRAPSSIANLGPLFDVAGLAVNHSYDVVHVELLGESSGIRVELEAPEGLPRGTGNTAYAAILRILEYLGETVHVRVRVEKGVPPGYGLGSSGASAAAAAYAVNLLLGEPLSREELVRFAGEAEAVAAGTPHYDNVAASLLGGLALVLDVEKPWVVTLKLPEDIRIVVFRPLERVVKAEAKTGLMRSVLPGSIGFREAVEWVRRGVALAAGLQADPYQALSIVSQGGVVEEARGRLIPGYSEAKRVALEEGAIAFNISGAGPTLFALVREGEEDRIAVSVSRVLEKFWGRLETRIVEVDYEGAREA